MSVNVGGTTEAVLATYADTNLSGEITPISVYTTKIEDTGTLSLTMDKFSTDPTNRNYNAGLENFDIKVIQHDNYAKYLNKQGSLI
jgi:hypothetical protein